jgi:hypothetical protein
MAADEPDSAGTARQRLRTAARLASAAARAGDPAGAYQLAACAARLAAADSDPGEDAPGQLERALAEADAEPEPARQAQILLDTFDRLAGRIDDAGPVSDDALTATQGFLGQAISIGAPAYNLGDHQGCYEVYACTARLILATVTGADEARQRLRAALARCRGLDDSNRRAWAMRHAFDEIAQMGEAAAPAVGPREARLYVSMAIQLGAPAYNLGDHRGCYEVYACTARMLLRVEGVPQEVRRLLRDALERASVVPEVGRQAWIMRHAFDAILGAGAEPED